MSRTLPPSPRKRSTALWLPCRFQMAIIPALLNIVWMAVYYVVRRHRQAALARPRCGIRGRICCRSSACSCAHTHTRAACALLLDAGCWVLCAPRRRSPDAVPPASAPAAAQIVFVLVNKRIQERGYQNM